MANFRYKELYSSIASSPTVTKRINTIAEQRFDAAKEELLNEFDNSKITQEIGGGIESDNISQTLTGAGGSGKEGKPNLFSFIGFESGDDPIAPLRDVLENDLHLAKSKKGESDGKSMKWRFSLRIPLEAIRNVTKMPWENGNSWVEQIERGISGFSNYLYGIFGKNSRSGGGLQTKQPVRAAATSAPKPYLSELFKNFIANIKNKN